MVRILLGEGKADANLGSPDVGATALMEASYFGHAEVVRILLQEGQADANQGRIDGG